MMLDVHHHILPPAYVDTLGQRIGSQGLLGGVPEWSPATSLDAMDRNGIRAAVVSVSAPGIWFGNVEETRRLARECNDYAAGMKGDHLGRFGMFALLPLPDIEGSLREIEYAVDVLGVEGFGLLTNYDGKYPGDVHYRPVFEELNRRKAVVFFHPVAAAYGPCMPEIPAPTLEFPFDTTRAITHLLYHGAAARYCDIRFIFAHAGGAAPFLTERIARLSAKPDFKANVPFGVRAQLARLYYDIALSANPVALAALHALGCRGNIMYGSDFPHAGEPTMTATVRGISALGLDADDMAAVEAETALELFPSLRVVEAPP
jgi:predicted TIM-barrel fold metal-dependent hydrolase